MKKYKKKLAALYLIGILGTGLMGCGNNQDTTTDLTVTPFSYESEFEEDFLSAPEVSKIETMDNTIVEEEETKEDEVEIVEVPIVVANTHTAVIDNVENGDIIGYLPVGRTADLVSTQDNGYCEIDYFGDTAYVKTENVSLAQVYDFKSPIKKILYAKEATTLVIPDYLSETGEQVTVDIPELECFEVYEEDEALYLVKTEEYIGYIAKDKVEELNGTIAVIDIDLQKVTLYKDNVLINTYPVVTGLPTKDRETDLGLWEIHNITGARYLIGENGSKTPVDIMMKFHGNEGFHDAEYHTCENWNKQHGWRDKSEFGSDTYINDGSHGCCNMRHEDVFELAEYITIGTPVLVKR